MPKQRAWNHIGMTPKTMCLSPYRYHRKQKCADADGFSRAPADAVGVVGREAFGVRQLAAAVLF